MSQIVKKSNGKSLQSTCAVGGYAHVMSETKARNVPE